MALTQSKGGLQPSMIEEETIAAIPEQQVEDTFYATHYAMEPDGDPTIVNEQIDMEYKKNGESATVRRVKDEVQRRSEQERNAYIAQRAAEPTTTLEDLEYEARLLNEVGANTGDLAFGFASDLATIDLTLSLPEREREDFRSEWVTSRVDQLRVQNQLLQRDVWSLEDEADVSLLGLFADFVGMALPFNEAKSWVAAAQALNLYEGPIDYATYGNTAKRIINHISNLRGEERELAKTKLTLALQESSGFFGDNHYMRRMIIDEAINNPLDDDSWFHAVNNAVGSLDVLGLAKFGTMTVQQAAKAVKNIGRVRGMLSTQKAAPANVVMTANPRVGEEVAAKIIADVSEETAKKAGTTRAATINDTVLPTPHPAGSPVKAIEGMPAKVLERYEQVSAHLTDALHRATVDIRTLYTGSELKAAQQSLVSGLEKFFSTSVNIATSPIEYRTDGMRLSAVFQADDYGGYRSLQDLYDDITAKFKEVSFEDLRIFHREGDADHYVDVTDDLEDIAARWKAGDTGDFVYSLKIDMPVSPEWKMALGEDAVQAGMGGFTKYLRGVAGYSDWIRNTASVAVDKVGAFNKDMQRALEMGFKGVGGKGWNPYKKNEAYKAVMEVVQKGAVEHNPLTGEAGKWYSPQELFEKFKFTDEQMSAYYSFKAVSDALYYATNADLYKTLRAEGMSSLTFPSVRGNKELGLVGRGLSVDDAAAVARTYKNGETLKAYNPVTGKEIALDTPEKVRRLYQQGKRVAVTRGKDKGGKGGLYTPDGKNYYEYLLVDEARGARIERLTHFPLKYREGHYYRSYKEGNFYIREKHPDAKKNGVSRELSADFDPSSAFAVAKNMRDANRIIKAKMAETGLPQDAYIVEKGAQWHTGKIQTDADWEIMERSMLSSQKGRKEWLHDVNDLEAEIEDPITALGKSISAVSSRLGKRDWYDANQSAWFQTYGKLFKAQGFPTTREELQGLINTAVQTKKGLVKAGKEALAYYDYIQMVRGTGTPIADKWRSWVFHSMSDTDVKLFQQMAPLAAKAGEFVNPTLRLKQSAFLMYLAWNPIKQLLLQPTQIVNMLAVNPAYMRSSFIPEFSAVLAELMGGKGGKLGKQLAKELDAAGVTKNVDHHQWINQSQTARLLQGDALKPASIRKLGHKAWKLPTEVGFAAGEKGNQIMHWLVARNEYAKAHPNANLMDKQHSEAILARMRDLSGGMNAAGKYGYQGWGGITGDLMSMVLQFASHSHKMLQLMIPQKVGGVRFLTPKQKATMAMTNTALAGAGLWPFVNDIISSMINENPELEMSPELYTALTRGILDVSLNKMIGMATGEDVDIDFAKTFTPTGAIETFAKNIYGSITNDPVRKWDFVAGVGAGGQILDTINVINSVWKTPEEVLDTPEKVQESLTMITELASGVSNWRKAEMIRTHGKVVSKNGFVIDEVALVESYAKLLGITLDAETSLYDMMDMSQDFRAGRQQIEDDAKTILRDVNRIIKDRPDLSTIDKYLMLNNLIVMAFEKPEERMIAQETIAKYVIQDMENGVDSIGVRLIRQAYEAGDVNAFKTFLRNHPDASPALRFMFEQLLNVQTEE